MKKLEKSVPIIRFKGFYEAWEQRKLEELAAFSKGSGYTKNDLVEKGMPLVLYGRLYTKYETIITEVNTFTKMKDKSVISKGNEVVVPSSGETAKDISRASVIGAEGFILGGDLNIIKPKRELNSIFLALTISNGEQQKEIIKRAQGKSVVHVYNTDLKQVKLSYPTFNEQEKIGSFFRQLDNAIALHQRKLDTLKRMKKGLLQQMFPNNEEKVPRLRFADFNEKWERCKISSFARNTYGGGTPKTNVPEYWQGRIPWIQSGDLLIDSLFNIIPKKHVTGSAVKSSATKCIPANSIAIVTRVGVGKLAFIPFEYTTSQDFLSLSNLRVDSNFGTYSIYIMLQRELNNIQGSTIKGITKSDLLEKNINKPLNRIEQERIGVSLKLLDNIITLHQSKLEKLSSLKKVYLQRMFI
ncbi:restriction endonuclease subunit S [Listeria monocytogenes]|uniref:restriction endonuclease subunit S n=1 Tax=Listeria monocytogenes TaxID=1639 RepID=UPI00074D5020|nr:restriction endonuclease subunit S [Listeria monocytogenes]EAA0138519.1 restriction endonuclease subunit S [Listeria monocytogenes]EAD0943626.1 restriction endonuclease subunit S [Listeria monocytogenes]EAE4874231.1 restriction endonuclease subunit S [Listeria monocytogenes]EAH0443796.1 restriction endonuclease subunit S [Listeria monocytogenes]MDA5985753.1 restriction endonuclease subunit S [Listeria monocytogenes]